MLRESVYIVSMDFAVFGVTAASGHEVEELLGDRRIAETRDFIEVEMESFARDDKIIFDTSLGLWVAACRGRREEREEKLHENQLERCFQ